MAPEYGATMGFFPVDEKTIEYFEGTGRTQGRDRGLRGLLQGAGDVRRARGRRHRLQRRWSSSTSAAWRPAWPARSGRRTASRSAPVEEVRRALQRADRRQRLQPAGRRAWACAIRSRVRPRRTAAEPTRARGRAPGAPRDVVEMADNRPRSALAASKAPTKHGRDGLTHRQRRRADRRHHSAAPTPATPSVLLAAGLLAKKAVEAGLKVQPHIKTSLAPGSRIVTEYLEKAGLLPYLEKLGFTVAAYGCTTCIGNAGDLTPEINEAIIEERPGLRRGAVGQPQLRGAHPPEPEGQLPGQPAAGGGLRDCRHRDARPDDRAGRQGQGRQGRLPRRHLAEQRRDLQADEVRDEPARPSAPTTATWQASRASCGTTSRASRGQVYDWPKSTYIAEPPFFDDFTMEPQALAAGRAGRARHGAVRRLDHHRPHLARRLRSRKPRPPATTCTSHGVLKADFNSYGARRGNHEVMMRGTFANVRIKNLMIPAGADGSREEGGVTLFQPGGEKMFIYDAAMKYIAAGTPTVVFAGEEYGTGSSPRLGRQGHAAAGHQGRGGAQLRAHPPQQPGRHGRAAAAVQGQRLVAVAGPRRATRVVDVRPRQRDQAAERRHAGDHAGRRHAARRAR